MPLLPPVIKTRWPGSSRSPIGSPSGVPSTRRFSRDSASALRTRRTASATGLPTTSEVRRSPGTSSIRTSVPPSTSRSPSAIVAVPSGRAFAFSTSRWGGSTSITSVWSLRPTGQDPTLWWKRDPTAGNSPSWSRTPAAPTTHCG